MTHDRKLLGLMLLAVVAAAGCKTTAGLKLEDAIQGIQFKYRQPGEQKIAGTDEVREKLGCTLTSGPIVRLEQHEVIPYRVSAGRNISHRIVYSACNLGDASEVPLVRRVLFNGRLLMEKKSSYSLKEGRWLIDAYIEIPSQAESGSYRLESRIGQGERILNASDYFTVRGNN